MADNARFHNKLHRKNHHTLPTQGYPDSGTDPIASHEEPFQGDFIVNASISAHNNLYVDNNATILGNLSVYGDFTYFETIVSITSALSVVNSGTGPALTIIQNGPQPIATFIDGDAGPLSGRYALMINDKGESVFGWGTVGPVHNLSAFQFGIVDNKDQPILIEEYNNAGSGVAYRGLRSRGDITSPAGVSANDALVGLQGWGMNLGGIRPTTRSPGSIGIFAAEAYTPSQQGSYITLTTTPVGSNSNSATERVRIAPYGHVGINTTEPVEARLTVRGNISASDGLSAHHGNFLGYVSAAQLRAYYTDTNHVTANYVFGYENESIFTDGFNLSGNGDGTLTINYTNGLYVSSAPVHFALALDTAKAVYFGRDSSANIYRLIPSTLKTDGNLVVSGSLSAGATNYNNLVQLGVSALAQDTNYHLIRGRMGINTPPITSFGFHLKGGNIRVDGVDYSMLPGFDGSLYDTDGQSLFDLRSAGVGANYSLSIAESGLGQFMKFFGGRTGDAQAFINVKEGTPLRFGSFSDFYGTDYKEYLRISGGGNVAIGYNVPFFPSFTTESTEKLGVSGNTFIYGSLTALGTTGRPTLFNQHVGIRIVNPLVALTVNGAISANEGLSARSATLYGTNEVGAVTLTVSGGALSAVGLIDGRTMILDGNGSAHTSTLLVSGGISSSWGLSSYNAYFIDGIKIGSVPNSNRSVELTVRGSISATASLSARDAVFFGTGSGTTTTALVSGLLSAQNINTGNLFAINVFGNTLSAAGTITGRNLVLSGDGSPHTSTILVSGGISSSWGLSANSVRAFGSLSATGPVFGSTLFAGNSSFISGTLSAAWISLSAIQGSTATLINPATATGEFLLLNINGLNRAIRLWEYTS